MKTKTLSLLTIVFGLFFLIFACRREIDDVIKTNVNTTSNKLLESAKTWNAKIVNENYAVNSKIPDFITLTPLWDKSWTINQQDGSLLIAVPTGVPEPSLRSMSLSRLFIFQATSSRIKNARIVEFFGFDYYSVNKNLEKLISHGDSPIIEGFNGAIIQYDLNYRWTSGALYENGRKTNNDVKIVRKKASGNNFEIDIALNRPVVLQSGKAAIETKMLYKLDLRVMSSGSGSGSGSGTMGGTLSEVTITGSSTTSGGGGGTGPIFPPPGGNPGTPNPPGTGGGDTNPPDLSIADKKVNCGPVPAKSGEITQVGNLCVFKALEFTTRYFNNEVPSGTSLLYYVGTKGTGIPGVVQVTSGGVPPGDVNGIINHYVDYKSPSSIKAAIDACHPCMAIFDGRHMVTITGYNNSGTIQYFDPELGKYQVTTADKLSNILEITKYNLK